MNYYIKIPCFSLEQTLESGQCFRWRRESPSDEPRPVYRGFSGERPLRVRQEADGITLLNLGEEDCQRQIAFWRAYFDADTDYEAIRKRFSADETLRRASEECRGLRILRQEPFETLISFILSQNNNIPRIRGIVERLCQTFGRSAAAFAEGAGFGFPSAERLAGLNEDALAPLRAGFRARYLLDAARKVSDGTVRLSAISEMSCEEGRAELKKIVGVGDKVADCVLLFAYHKTEAFPSDVWIKRITAEYYKDGLPECVGSDRGIAQQYLFEYFRKAPRGGKASRAC